MESAEPDRFLKLGRSGIEEQVRAAAVALIFGKHCEVGEMQSTPRSHSVLTATLYS